MQDENVKTSREIDAQLSIETYKINNASLKIKLIDKNAKVPMKNNEEDAAWDIFSCESFALSPGERHCFKTGICVECPENFWIHLLPRSGHAAKSGIMVMGGVIDPAYRGEYGVILYNSDKESIFKVDVGDKICQMAIIPKIKGNFTIVESLSDSTRGESGFGSSGK